MENQPMGQRPQRTAGKRFWHIWGSFIIYWILGSVVSTAAVMVFTGQYMAGHLEEVMAAYGDQGAMQELIVPILETMNKYTTEITGITALIGIPIMLFWYRKDIKTRKAYGIAENRKAPVIKYGIVILFSAAMGIALNNLILIGDLASFSESYTTTAEAMYSASLGMQILCLGLLAPIVEELVFRGIMYRRIREDTKVGMAIIYSALIFGIFHGNLVQALYGMIMGAAFAYLYEKYGSVMAPIIAHIVANLISILATELNLFDRLLEDKLIGGVLTVACATIAAIMFLGVQSIEERPKGSEEKVANILEM